MHEAFRAFRERNSNARHVNAARFDGGVTLTDSLGFKLRYVAVYASTTPSRSCQCGVDRPGIVPSYNNKKNVSPKLKSRMPTGSGSSKRTFEYLLQLPCPRPRHLNTYLRGRSIYLKSLQQIPRCLPSADAYKSGHSRTYAGAATAELKLLTPSGA